MKSLIIVCIMGLISIFSCKVDGDFNDNEETIKNEVLGDELINQSLWNVEGLAWWDLNTGNWFGNGVFISSNNSGNLKKNDFWVIGKKYRCCFTTDYRTGGNFKPFTDGTNVVIIVNVNGVYTVDVIAVATFMIIESDGYIGAVTALSVKEII